MRIFASTMYDKASVKAVGSLYSQSGEGYALP